MTALRTPRMVRESLSWLVEVHLSPSLVASSFGVALLSIVSGCAVHVPPCMRAATPGATTSEANAIVVFAREGTPCDRGGFVRILENDGRYVGDVAPGARFAVAVPPGEHMFLGWNLWFQEQPDRDSYNATSALHASLAPGRTYYVNVRLTDLQEHPRCARSSIVELLPMTPHNAQGEDIASLVADTEPQEPSEACGQELLLDQRALVDKHVRQAARTWEAYSPKTKAERTIAPDDGI